MRTNLIWIGILFNTTLLACDVCGCYMGILPYDNQSSISFMHRYRVFNGYRNYQHHYRYFPDGAYKTAHGSHPADTSLIKNYSSKDYESFKVYELRVKYFIHKRIELNGIIGINSNRSKEDSMTYRHTGLGDPSFFIGYHLIQPSLESQFKHRLIGGLGVKIPSGNYYAKTSEGIRLPYLMQPGTGSVDYFTYVNYVLGIKKLGLSTTCNFKYNGSNYYHERMGHSLTNFSSFFYKISFRSITFIPALMTYYEFTKGLYKHHELIKGTGMNEMMIGFGTDLYYKNLGLSISAQRTVLQQTDPSNLRSVGRLTVSLNYNFNQRKHLLK